MQQFWVIVLQLGGEQSLRGSQFFGFVSSVAEGTKARSFGCFPPRCLNQFVILFLGFAGPTIDSMARQPSERAWRTEPGAARRDSLCHRARADLPGS
jgi:hypothetical protein